MMRHQYHVIQYSDVGAPHVGAGKTTERMARALGLLHDAYGWSLVGGYGNILIFRRRYLWQRLAEFDPESLVYARRIPCVSRWAP